VFILSYKSPFYNFKFRHTIPPHRVGLPTSSHIVTSMYLAHNSDTFPCFIFFSRSLVTQISSNFVNLFCVSKDICSSFMNEKGEKLYHVFDIKTEKFGH
jgi:hypothetical protein